MKFVLRVNQFKKRWSGETPSYPKVVSTKDADDTLCLEYMEYGAIWSGGRADSESLWSCECHEDYGRVSR